MKPNGFLPSRYNGFRIAETIHKTLFQLYVFVFVSTTKGSNCFKLIYYLLKELLVYFDKFIPVDVALQNISFPIVTETKKYFLLISYLLVLMYMYI